MNREERRAYERELRAHNKLTLVEQLFGKKGNKTKRQIRAKTLGDLGPSDAPGYTPPTTDKGHQART